MAIGGGQKKEKSEGRSGQKMRKRNRRETERRRCVEEVHGVKTNPLRLEEAENRRKPESRRIQSIEEGEDAQKPATFWEERGQIRYGVYTGNGEEG
ncbi:hypothetical protein NDU88_007263 [Pleurodeles waltl]|uniref:Uncharacterized protein n=1 Tax=Pleurodeles waltl TaxID=8319 RepID=A0AAV7NVG7_PLEWA|nr:hypothetical protein NDU88_007263 [Pleurodeles waltl]